MLHFVTMLVTCEHGAPDNKQESLCVSLISAFHSGVGRGGAGVSPYKNDGGARHTF